MYGIERMLRAINGVVLLFIFHHSFFLFCIFTLNCISCVTILSDFFSFHSVEMSFPLTLFFHGVTSSGNGSNFYFMTLAQVQVIICDIKIQK